MKTLTLILFITFNLFADISISGTISGEGLIKPNTDISPVFKINFYGGDLYPSDSVLSQTDYSYSYFRPSISPKWIFITYIKNLTPGFKTLDPDTFFDTITPNTEHKTHNFTVKDISRPEILNIIIPTKIYMKSTDTLQYTVLDNSGWVTSRLIGIFYKTSSELINNTINNYKDSIAFGSLSLKKVPFTTTKSDSAIIRIIYGDAANNYDTAFSNKFYIIDTSTQTCILNSKKHIKTIFTGRTITLENSSQVSLYMLNGKCLYTKKYPAGRYVLDIPYNKILIMEINKK